MAHKGTHRFVPQLHQPHSPEAERGLLGAAMLCPEVLRQAKVPVEAFYDTRHATLWQVLCQMHEAGEVIDSVTLVERLRKERLLRQAGDMAYVASLPDHCPSPANAPHYAAVIRERYAQRLLARTCVEALESLRNGSANSVWGALRGALDSLEGWRARQGEDPARMYAPGELANLEIHPDMWLVGDGEIVRGELAVMAGPGSVGKSLAAVMLAVCGARGDGRWMGRLIRRRFKTMIIQAENGAVRLKHEFAAIRRNHPELELDDWIRISDPPEGGIPFHRAAFRSWVRDQVHAWQPDLVVLDPWSQIAVEDASKDVVDKLVEIRSCFPADRPPALLIVAHTKKPRPEDVHRGRSLVYLVSGTIALTNCARCVYMLLPWSDDPEDDRVYFACPKLNNAEMYPPSVWRRRFGTFWVPDPETDPRDWGQSDENSREAITLRDLEEAFGEDAELRSGELVKRLRKVSGAAESTCWRAIGEDGYLRHRLIRTVHGRLKLRDPREQGPQTAPGAADGGRGRV